MTPLVPNEIKTDSLNISIDRPAPIDNTYVLSMPTLYSND